MDRTHLPRSSVGSVALAVALWTLAASTARAECPAPPATVDLADGFALCTPAAPGYPEGTAVAMRVGLPDGTLIAAGIGVIGKPVPLTVPAGVLGRVTGHRPHAQRQGHPYRHGQCRTGHITSPGDDHALVE